MYSCPSPTKITGLLPTEQAMNFQLWGDVSTHMRAWDKTFLSRGGSFTLFKMKNLISTKRIPDIKPDNRGEINQEATVLKKKKKDRMEHETNSIVTQELNK